MWEPVCTWFRLTCDRRVFVHAHSSTCAGVGVVCTECVCSVPLCTPGPRGPDSLPGLTGSGPAEPTFPGLTLRPRAPSMVHMPRSTPARLYLILLCLHVT